MVAPCYGGSSKHHSERPALHPDIEMGPEVERENSHPRKFALSRFRRPRIITRISDTHVAVGLVDCTPSFSRFQN